MTTFTATGLDLYDALANILPHVGKDDTLPVLTCVQVEVGEDGLVTLAGTDRYTLGVVELVSDETADLEPGVFLWPREAIAETLKTAKKTNRGVVTVACDGDKITVTTFDTSSVSLAGIGEYPKWRTLWPEDETTEHPHPVMAFSTLNLAKFAKVYQHGAAIKRHIGVFIFRLGETPTKPVVATCREIDGLRVLLMPCRPGVV